MLLVYIWLYTMWYIMKVNLNFRAKISEMGDKVIIIIPKAFHKDTKPLQGDFVEVEIKKLDIINKISYYDIVTISLVVLTAFSVILFNILIISLIQIAAPVALFPDLTQCQGQPFEGNPNIIEYKCPPKLTILAMPDKCKFFDHCPLVQPMALPVTMKTEAQWYCGKYQENEKHGLIKFQKKNR